LSRDAEEACPIVEGVTTYQWLLDGGIPAGRIAFAGDSAGGHLAMTIQLRARGQGLPLPVATMLLSPWIDLLDDSRMLAKHAGQAGVDVQIDEFPDQQHSFQMAAGFAPEADDAINRFAAWVRPRLLGKP
jgi:acetyl esterase/lipase